MTQDVSLAHKLIFIPANFLQLLDYKPIVRAKRVRPSFTGLFGKRLNLQRFLQVYDFDI